MSSNPLDVLRLFCFSSLKICFCPDLVTLISLSSLSSNSRCCVSCVLGKRRTDLQGGLSELKSQGVKC